MSSKDEALKMAIETLEKHGFMEDSTFDDVVKACKEALEQPAYETESWKNNMKEAEEILAKAKFEGIDFSHIHSYRNIARLLLIKSVVNG